MNEQLRAELAEREAVDSERRQGLKETARSESLTRDEKLELLRLRSEVTQLKAAVTASREVVKSALENREEAMTRVAAERNGRQNDNSFNTADLTFRGYATPEDGYASGIAAMKEGDMQTMLNSMTPEEAARWEQLNAGKTDEEIRARFMKEFGSNSTIRVKGQEQVSPTEVVLDVEMERPFTKRVRMNLVGNEWKGGAPINQNKQPMANQGVAANEQDGAYDPLAFYRKNPELMRRYFPHLMNHAVQQQQAQVPPTDGTLPPEPSPNP